MGKCEEKWFGLAWEDQTGLCFRLHMTEICPLQWPCKERFLKDHAGSSAFQNFIKYLWMHLVEVHRFFLLWQSLWLLVWAEFVCSQQFLFYNKNLTFSFVWIKYKYSTTWLPFSKQSGHHFYPWIQQTKEVSSSNE